MLVDKLKARGEVYFVLTDANGNVKESHKHNTVVNTGLAFMTDRITNAATPPAVMSHIALGTSNGLTGVATTPKEQIALAAEIGTRASATVTRVNSIATIPNDTMQFVASFGATISTGAIMEAGIFNNATTGAGTMLARTTFPVINKGAGDSLTITWKVTLAST